MNKVFFWLEVTRAYALPMSLMAWVIPFAYAYTNKGNILHGFLALVAIICVHLGANLFDDIIDYKKHIKDKERNSSLNLKKGKCKYFIEETISVKKALVVVFGLFSIACLIGGYFVFLYKLPIIILMGVTGLLCLLYPVSGFWGLSEIIIGLIYAPLLFTGVYYVMTGDFSSMLEWLSLSFALVTVTLLYTDFFLDYNTDKAGGKRTLPVLCGNKTNAYYLYIFIIFLIYANLFFGIHSHVFSLKHGLILVSIIPALKTIKNLQYYLTREIKDEKAFMATMMDVQKYIAIFAVLCVVVFFIKF